MHQLRRRPPGKLIAGRDADPVPGGIAIADTYHDGMGHVVGTTPRSGRSVRVEPLDATFGAIVRDVVLAGASDATISELTELWLEYALLVFPGQHLTPDEQDEFARRFGDLEFTATPLTNIQRDGTLRSTEHDLSKSLRANERWHHDSTYMPVQAMGAVFTAEIVPHQGGDTGFADMRAAYDALDVATRVRIGSLAAFHSRRYSMDRADLHVDEENAGRYQIYGYGADIEPPLRPLVKVHPITGRPNLLIGQHAHAIPGLTDDDSEALLDRLNDEACMPPRTYHHVWTEGDALLWDNRCLMHRATPHEPRQARRMWHTRIAGDPVTEAGLDH
jgi:alpha-ketoglutarate-dependent taurine dioxygenase